MLLQEGLTESFLAGFIGDDFPGLGNNGRKVLAVGHSLGGIVLKAWLLRLYAASQAMPSSAALSATASEQQLQHSLEDSFMRQVQIIIFIAVPHKGAACAKAGSRLAFPWSSTWLNLLGKRAGLRGTLHDLEVDFQLLLDKYQIPILSIYECVKTKVSFCASTSSSHDFRQSTSYASITCAESESCECWLQ